MDICYLELSFQSLLRIILFMIWILCFKKRIFIKFLKMWKWLMSSLIKMLLEKLFWTRKNIFMWRNKAIIIWWFTNVIHSIIVCYITLHIIISLLRKFIIFKIVIIVISLNLSWFSWNNLLFDFMNILHFIICFVSIFK